MHKLIVHENELQIQFIFMQISLFKNKGFEKAPGFPLRGTGAGEVRKKRGQSGM